MSEKVNTSHLRKEYIRYIKEHEHLPEYVKEIAIENVVAHFGIMGKVIGILELSCARTERAVKERAGDDM